MINYLRRLSLVLVVIAMVVGAFMLLVTILAGYRMAAQDLTIMLSVLGSCIVVTLTAGAVYVLAKNAEGRQV